ncbi:MAG: tetratricopeptide repeat protein [Hyphomicrobiaceae bacterium]
MAVALLTGVASVSTGAAAGQFRSPEEALQQGIGAFSGGYYEMAIPALEVAAAHNLFFAQYYLARIYSDNQGAHTDHPKAYMLYQRIANDYADVDPDDDARAPFVAKSLTALAGYVRRGLPEVGLRPNAERSADYLHHAAIFFNDEDAQFELAKLQLKGEGVPSDVAQGKHWLSILSQKGHAGAQAFLADLYWRGMHMTKDQVRALALISVAVKNAPGGERVWIEDIYQNIYCGASTGVRKQVGGMVAEWDSRYGRRPEADDRNEMASLDHAATRTCENGEVVPLEFAAGSKPSAGSVPEGKAAAAPMPPALAGGKSAPPSAGGPLLGVMGSGASPALGLRDAGDVGGAGSGTLR